MEEFRLPESGRFRVVLRAHSLHSGWRCERCGSPDKTEAIYWRYAIVHEAQLRDPAAKLARMARLGQSPGQGGDPNTGAGVSEGREKMVGRDGIEPPTPGFSVLCSTN